MKVDNLNSRVVSTICLGLLTLAISDACNVTITTHRNSSVLTSPNYPYKYPSNLDCWWRVVGSHKDSNVVVAVVYQFTEYSVNCTHDSLSIYDGSTSTFPLLGRLCGSNMVTYLSSGNSVFIRFRTDGQNERRGFKLELAETTGCGGKLTATSNFKDLVSPGYPYEVTRSMNCSWTITAGSDLDMVQVEFVRLYISHISNCVSSITVYSDNTTNANAVLGVLCNQSPTPVFISSKIMLIDFKTSGLSARQGFTMRYKTVKAGSCEVTLQADAYPLYFVSPGYPDSYSNNLVCVWRIVSRYQYINLRVITSDIEGTSPECGNDAVRVFSDKITAADELGTFCGNATPTYTSNNWGMVVEFRTNRKASGKGFRIQYRSSGPYRQLTTLSPTTPCGPSELSALDSVQYLHSPGYPKSYHNNEKCIWTLTATYSSKQVRVVVLDSHVESSPGCTNDFVATFDGNSTKASELRSWCADMAPTVQSTGQSLTIVFQTDRSMTSSGFQLEYFQTNEQYTCGGHVNASNGEGYLTSPGYPDSHDRNRHCEWTIQTSKSDTILNITVLDSRMDDSISCNHDGVKVTDGIRSNSTLLGEFCGNMRPTYLSSGQAVTLAYSIGSENITRGFKLKYTPLSFKCRGTEFYADKTPNSFTSPFYPITYPSNADCFWRIDTRDPQLKVYIHLDAHIPFTFGCGIDQIEVFDGFSSNSTLIGRWCGGIHTAYSSGRYVFIKFTTDSNAKTDRGFKITYQAKHPNTSVCNRVVLATPDLTNVTSLNYPNEYPENSYCWWIFRARDPKNIVVVEVADMSIKKSPNCARAFLSFYDGRNNLDKLIRTFCGDTRGAVSSTGDVMYAQFQTAQGWNGTGFRLVVFEMPNCHEVDLLAKTAPSFFVSSHYPYTPNGTECSWRIDSKHSHFLVVLDFTMQLQNSTGRKTDYIEAYDGYNSSYKLLGRWCGVVQLTAHSTGRYMYLKYHTDSFVEHHGFNFTYTAKLCLPEFNIGVVTGEVASGMMTICVIGTIVFMKIRKHISRRSRIKMEANYGHGFTYIDLGSTKPVYDNQQMLTY